PDGKSVAAVDTRGSLRTWDPGAGNTLSGGSINLDGEGFKNGGFLGLAYAPDGKQIVTWGTDNVIRLWPLVPGRPGPSFLEAKELSCQSFAGCPSGRCWRCRRCCRRRARS